MPQVLSQDRTRVDLPLALPWLCPLPTSGQLARWRIGPSLVPWKRRDISPSPALEGGDGMLGSTTTLWGAHHSDGNLGLQGVHSSFSWLPLPLPPAAPATIANPINHLHSRQSPGMWRSHKSQPWVKQTNQPGGF